MQRLELPADEPRKVISAEKAASFRYKLVQAGVYLALVGVIGFFIAFFYQKPINAAGVPYRQVQVGAIVVVFAGAVLFYVFCSMLGISTRKMTYNKLMSIMHNRAEIPFDVNLATRKQIAMSLTGLEDVWTLYPTIFADDPQKSIPMVIVGPGGVYPIHVIYQDPHKKEFVDPMPALKVGSIELEKRLKTTVKPILGFLRSKKHYPCDDDESVKTFSTAELYAYLKARQVTLQEEELRQIDLCLRDICNLPARSSNA